MENNKEYSFDELLVKYLKQERNYLSVSYLGEEEDVSAFQVSFMDDGVIHNHITFILSDFLNDIVYFTKYDRAINYLKDQPTLMMLVEAIVFKTMVAATKEERRSILNKYEDLDNDLFLDETSFFTLRYIFKILIEDKNKLEK